MFTAYRVQVIDKNIKEILAGTLGFVYAKHANYPKTTHLRYSSYQWWTPPHPRSTVLV